MNIDLYLFSIPYKVYIDIVSVLKCIVKTEANWEIRKWTISLQHRTTLETNESEKQITH